MNRNKIIMLVVFALAVLVVYQNGFAKDKDVVLSMEVAAKPNYIAPSFELMSMEQEVFTVGEKRDKPLLLNFWASWCDPCELEAPDLKAMHDKYKDQLDIYGVNLTKDDNLEAARSFVERYKLEFPILLDTKGDVRALYRIQIIPTSYLIDRNGMIKEVIHLEEPKALERKIKQLIKD